MTQLFSPQNKNSSCNVFKSLNETLTLCKIETRGIKIELTWPSDVPRDLMISISPVSFFQIIFNLVVNSSQALNSSSKNDSWIKINVTLNTKFVKINIIDNGPGLPESIKQNLFKPYLTTKKGGHGLGLVIAKNFIEKCHGTLNYITENEPIGAHFELQFPVSL